MKYCVEIVGMCIELGIRLKGNILTLFIYWNHIDKDYQVVKFKGIHMNKSTI